MKINFKSAIQTFIFAKFSLCALIKYFSTLVEFYSKFKKSNYRFNLFPIFNNFNPRHEFDSHYTYHPAWAIRKVRQINPSLHIDLASKLDFSLAVSSFTKVEYHDYRHVKINLSDFQSFYTDITNLPFGNDSIFSLSCMHVLEHVGLGRYGDPINIDGDLIAAREIERVVMPGGHFLFVVPLSFHPRIEFNAHRVYDCNTVMDMFSEFSLLEFSYIDDDGSYFENCTFEHVNNQMYGCGCFHFIKRRK